MSARKLFDMFENKVPGLSLMIYAFAIIDFAILIICVLYSADQDLVRITNRNNEVVYEADYNLDHIAEFKQIYGIEDFQKEGFVVSRVEIDNQFPTRAWIALSICVPMVIILFVVFLVKIFQEVFHSKKEDPDGTEAAGMPRSDFEETKFEKVFSTLGRLNIYSLGGTVILIVFLYWMIPDFLIYLGKISYQTIKELKWVILGVVSFGGIYLLVSLYLTYQTKKEMIRQQAEIQKHRDRLVIEAKSEKKLLEDRPN